MSGQMMLIYYMGAIAVLVVCKAFGESTSTIIVDLGYAKYEGLYNSTSNINTWYGIRYAQPPVGILRWQAPKDIEATQDTSTFEITNATAPGPPCVQVIPAWATADLPTGSEDCLLLDVKVPANASSSDLPVMVQIHGYTAGSSETAPGDALVYESQGTLIYVSIQYRLGAYGFLGGSEVLGNGAANVGLLDQRSALNWVQRHIHKFGGDASKVTIIGGSAGGGSVLNQMILYGGVSNPPFRAVIAEYPWWQPFHDDSVLQKQYDLLLGTTGCANLECLRSISASALANASQVTLTRAYASGDYGYGDFFYGPYVDGSVIRDLPSQEFKNGHFTNLPLLTSREGYEGVLFSNRSETSITEEVLDLNTLFPNAKQSFFNRLFELYPIKNFNSTFFQRQQIFGDSIISCPTNYIAAAVSDAGSAVYKMVFNAGSEIHASIGPFVETVNLNGTSNNASLAKIVRSYYVSFSLSLDPNTVSYTGVARPLWPLYQSGESPAFSVLGINYTTINATRDPDSSAQCDFFHGQSFVVRN